ncbi:hypothetical protein BC332_10704 [Capsicum chinense]|nr:hypothetical protein BC332_10704 [Capsicum chinense]
MKSKVSPLKPKGSPVKKRTYIRKKKDNKATISDVASELNSMPSSMEAKVKDATPRKSIRQKFLGQLAKSSYVAYFDSGASQSIFYQKHPFIYDIEAFDNLSSLNIDFWAFIECGLNTSKCDPFILSQHLDKIFYYMRMKAKYEPNIVVKLTTTDFVFRNKIDALYHNFVKNREDFSAMPEKHKVEKYIRGFYCDANIPWNKVDYVLFTVYVLREKSKLGHL